MDSRGVGAKNYDVQNSGDSERPGSALDLKAGLEEVNHYRTSWCGDCSCQPWRKVVEGESILRGMADLDPLPLPSRYVLPPGNSTWPPN